MIPVELRLENFLSYGTSAPTLYFDQFHVACLSGRNGQGKSALLDAITWALWGEARKTSGGGKPDEDLLHIGAREMRVELVFDLEGERYRVLRIFSKSASGKTSKPKLELQAFDPDASDFTPLTGTGIRETQAYLNNLLGIDYQTFINSAFLLQGRSDEFTKKKPSERKQILARILNLSKYDRLADLAGQRYRAADEQAKLAGLEVERLATALADEATWKAEHAEAKAQQATLAEQVEQRRAARTALTEQRAQYEARAREADALQKALDGLRLRTDQDARQAATLEQRIAEAAALIAQKPKIEADFARYETLQKEREDLDTKRDLHRGLEKQVEQRTADLKERQRARESDLHRLEVERKADEQALRECEARLVERPMQERMLQKAKKAQAAYEQMLAVRTRRIELDAEIGRLEKALLGEQESLRGQLASLESDLEAARQQAAAKRDFAAEEQELRRAKAALEAAQQRQEQVTVEGQQLKESIREQEGRLQLLKQERQKQAELMARMQQLQETTCPTCGTPLDDAHRAEVTAQYRATLAELRARIADAEQHKAEQVAKRERLVQQFRTEAAVIEQHKQAPEKLATLEAERTHQAAAQQALTEKSQQAAALRERLAQKDFGHEDRAARQRLVSERDALAFDAERFDRLAQEAAQVARFQDQLARLDTEAEKKTGLERRILEKATEAERLRQQLAEGTHLRPLQAQIEQLQQQMAAVGFDPGRHASVRQALAELGDAGARLRELANAQQNHADWQQQAGSLQERLTAARAEIGEKTQQLAAVQATLTDRSEIEARFREATTALQAAEAAAQALQTRLGELRARLDRARQDRALLRQRRKDQSEHEAQRNLYKHLRTAFGKNGIPSLIIEQTLPEIEERANALLHRLSDGRMYVQLETLKDKKSGGTKETLDIIITDEQGQPRPYETFSGGEAFRVNFALRIALAQLLAERSGVRIRTLVIDEGFGTQDEQGVQNLVEAIQAIQDDFDKIIVITHLDQLKEAFPVRIEVVKDPVAGSQFEIMGV